MLDIAQRTVILSGQRLDLQSNFCAWMTVEDITARPYTDVIAAFLGPKKLRAAAQLLWALSASYRSLRGLPFAFTSQEQESGFPAPGGFLDLLPAPPAPEWYQLREVLGDLLMDAGHTSTAVTEDNPLV